MGVGFCRKSGFVVSAAICLLRIAKICSLHHALPHTAIVVELSWTRNYIHFFLFLFFSFLHASLWDRLRPLVWALFLSQPPSSLFYFNLYSCCCYIGCHIGSCHMYCAASVGHVGATKDFACSSMYLIYVNSVHHLDYQVKNLRRELTLHSNILA